MRDSILRLPELIAYTGLSRSAIYDRMDENSPRYDASFPKQIRLGGTAVGWKQSDVDQWIENCKNSPIEASQRYGRLEKVRKPKQVKKAATSRTIDLNHELPSDDLTPKLQFTEQFIASLRMNEYLKACLRLPTWTPAMAALLASGVKAPLGCTEIPLEGEGIDGDVLTASDERLRLARSIFKEWNSEYIEYDENDEPCGVLESPSELRIVDFFIWFDESKIDTDWLRLILEVAGAPVPGSVRHIHTSLAMQVSQSLPNAPASSAGDSKANGTLRKAQETSKKPR
jgi:predicted DNA-binding transcriptional regulator AlpA